MTLAERIGLAFVVVAIPVFWYAIIRQAERDLVWREPDPVPDPEPTKKPPRPV